MHRPARWILRSVGALLGGGASVLVAARSVAADAGPLIEGATPIEWSRRMAQSEMTRRGDGLFYGAPNARWDYTSGLFGQALLRVGKILPDPAMVDYGAKLANSFVAPDGSIRTYQASEYNLDMITAGNVLLAQFDESRSPQLLAPLQTLRAQLARQPRTADGGFWHKQRYPHQMWLDGLFMASPFLAHYGSTFHEPADFDDAAQQIRLADCHTFDARTGLYYHAWDEQKAQPWANQQTGHSPNFWGRAEGWYAMAIVDCLDFIPPTHPEADKINAVLRRVADGIARWQDPDTGVWWQVLDQGARPGNYLEASASSMFVYALAKGVNRGYLPREKFEPVVRRGYEGLIRRFVRTDAAGMISLTHCCAVAGLGYTSASGRPRDGSFDYYVSEPVVDNDLKGIGPFIQAGLEVQTLLSTGNAMVAGARSWDDAAPILARIREPQFPARDFPITAFGAQPGGDASNALRDALAACAAAGGGRVIVPAGEWRTGPVRLPANTNLHVAKGATLHWVFEPARHPLVLTRWEGVECMNYAPLIYAMDAENVAVTGEGTLDGGAEWSTWWSWCDKRDGAPPKQKPARDRLLQLGEAGTPVAQRVFGEGGFLRPNFITFYRCRNVLVAGVTIVRSPMWEIHPVFSENVTVRGIRIDSHGPNNDGCDPDSCRDVLIEDCTFDTGDDCIALKSGRNADGRRTGRPTENVIVRHCRMKDGHGGVVLGSECSGGIRNVFVEDCRMDSPQLERALRIKSNAARGGVLENIFFRHVQIGKVAEAILAIDLRYEEAERGDFPPTVRNLQMEDVTSEEAPRILSLRGLPGATLDGIRLRDCAFNGVTSADIVENAGRIIFDRVAVNPGAPSARAPRPHPAP